MSSLPYRLVATDLDGTLLNSGETVSERTVAALAAATAAGAAHIVVTGRSAAWARPVFDEIGYRGLAVCGQGAQLYDADAHRIITSVTFDRQLAALALSRIEAEVGPLAVAATRDGLDGEVIAGPGYELIISSKLSTVRAADPDALWAAPISKFFIQHPTLDDDALTAAATKAVGHLVGVLMAGEGMVEILPLGLSKATGLSIAARRLGVTRADTIAFGDMPNDLPMFGWAGYGVAMANAHDQLRAVADEVTASNDEDGVALVLERLLRAV